MKRMTEGSTVSKLAAGDDIISENGRNAATARLESICWITQKNRTEMTQSLIA
jgi:hypothetical protein